MGLDIYWYKTNKKTGAFRKFMAKCYELDAYEDSIWRAYTKQELAAVDAMEEEIEELREYCKKEELNNDLFPNRKAHAIAQWIIRKDKGERETSNGLVCPKFGVSFLSKDDIYELVQKLNRICEAKMLRRAIDKEFPVIKGMVFADRAIDYLTPREDWEDWRDSFGRLYKEMTRDEEIAVEFSW